MNGEVERAHAGERPAASSPPRKKARMLKVKVREKVSETLNTMLQLNDDEAKQNVQELMLVWTYSVFLTDSRFGIRLTIRQN